MSDMREDAERLAKDCKHAAQVLRDIGAFRSGQAVLDDAAALIRAQAAEIERLTALDTPAPQPDADEREALVYLIECTLQEHPAQHESAWHRAHYVADALLAAGWTRKREEG